MRVCNGTEVCEIVGLFLLNNLANKFDKTSVGLYRDDGLALFKNISGHRADKIRKEFHQLFKENKLSLEIECNLKTVNYLDITLDLNIGTYKPYRKPNDKNFISTLNPITLQIFLNNYLYQLKLDYLTFPAIFNTNHQIMKMKAKLNRPKIAKETSSGSTRLFQRTSLPNNHKYHKIFNKNNVKISCSCMANIKSIINTHNKEVITAKETQAVN